jgi:uncharacterized protein (DUF1778 family)
MNKTIIARCTINVRITHEDRNLFDLAAKAQGKTLNAFILAAARNAAEEELLDRSIVRVNADAYYAFLDRLDTPPAPNKRLNNTLQLKAPWEG